jgi:pimeloyl-ACP methyl ester carboxylesterase
MDRAVRPYLRRAFIAVIAVLLVVLAGSLAACGEDGESTTTVSAADTTTSSDVSVEPTVTTRADTGSPEVVTFTTDDGVTLSGNLYGTGRRGVVLAHMYPADQTSWSAMAEELAQQGYLVLTFDFRGYGDSGGDKDIAEIDKDVTAAFFFMRTVGASEVMLIGASMGGTASLMAAVDLQTISSLRLAGVITLSSPVAFEGLSASDAVPALGVPLLFVAAEGDVGAENARALVDLGKSGNLLIVDGDEHGTDLFSGPAADQVRAALFQFLEDNMIGAE